MHFARSTTIQEITMKTAKFLSSRRLGLAFCAGGHRGGPAAQDRSAQAYPAKPIKVVVGYAAGGAVDAVARAVGQAMSTSMGQPVVIENKPGAGTNIAVKYVIAAEPDGYTLMLAANALAANMALYQPAPFDAERDLVPVSLVGRVPVVIAVNTQTGPASLAKLIERQGKARQRGLRNTG